MAAGSRPDVYLNGHLSTDPRNQAAGWTADEFNAEVLCDKRKHLSQGTTRIGSNGVLLCKQGVNPEHIRQVHELVPANYWAGKKIEAQVPRAALDAERMFYRMTSTRITGAGSTSDASMGVWAAT